MVLFVVVFVVVVVVGKACRECCWVAVVIGVDGEQNLCVPLLRSRSAFLLHNRSVLLLHSRSTLLLCSR